MKQRSLSLQLRLIFSVSVFVIMALQWVLVTYSIQHATRLYVQSRLEHDAESLLVALSQDIHQGLRLDLSKLNPTFMRPFSGHYYRLQMGSVDFVSPSLWNFELKFHPNQQVQAFEAPGPQQQQLWAYQQVVSQSNTTMRLIVAEDLSLLNSQLRQFNLNYGLFSLLVLALLWLAQNALLKLVLKPLRQVQKALSHLEQGQEVYLNEQTVTELQPVVQAINGLLSLQHQRLIRLRNSLGDLSHALKRPLSRIHQLLEERPWPLLEQELDLIGQQIEHQLKRARFAGSHALLKKIHLLDILKPLTQALDKIHRDKDLHFEVHCPPELMIEMDHQDAMELFGNLLDNAAKWAQQNVLITAEVQKDRLEIRIADDGPGVADELLDQISERGVRADQQVPGHGLGLAIVQDIAQVYGAQLELVRSPSMGGLEVRLYLKQSHAG